MEQVTIQNKVSIHSDVVSRKVQDEEVILNLETGTYFGLDEVGTRVWELLQQKLPLTSVIETLVEEYEVESEQAEKDVIALIRDLKKCQLVEIQ